MKRPRNQARNRNSQRTLDVGHPAQWSLPLRAMCMGLGMIVCVMVLLGASGQGEDAGSASLTKIEKMSPAQRGQFKRNYEKYQKLTSQQKEQYRKIHVATQNQDQLNRLMRSYSAWVKTLSPWEQEDLRKAGMSKESIEKRIELIRQFRTHRDRSKQEVDYHIDVLRLLAANPKEAKLDLEPLRLIKLRAPRPPADLFQEAIRIIESDLQTADKYPKLENELSEYERSLAILQSSLGSKDRTGPSIRPNGLPPEAMEKIVKLLDEENYKVRVFVGKRDSSSLPRGIQDRVKVMFFLSRGLMDQFIRSAREQLDQVPVSDEELQKFFETSLKTQDQDNLMNYSPEVMQEKLKYHYLHKHLPEEVKRSLQRQLKDFGEFVNPLTRGNKPNGAFRAGKGRLNDQRDRGIRRPGGGKNSGRKSGPRQD